VSSPSFWKSRENWLPARNCSIASGRTTPSLISSRASTHPYGNELRVGITRKTSALSYLFVILHWWHTIRASKRAMQKKLKIYKTSGEKQTAGVAVGARVPDRPESLISNSTAKVCSCDMRR
jgi:hypothetical protein